MLLPMSNSAQIIIGILLNVFKVKQLFQFTLRYIRKWYWMIHKIAFIQVVLKTQMQIKRQARQKIQHINHVPEAWVLSFIENEVKA